MLNVGRVKFNDQHGIDNVAKLKLSSLIQNRHAASVIQSDDNAFVDIFVTLRVDPHSRVDV